MGGTRAVGLLALGSFAMGTDACRAFGSAAGLAVLDAVDEQALAGSHLLPTVRGDLLARAGRGSEAAAAFRQAAGLTRNESERSVLLVRADELS